MAPKLLALMTLLLLIGAAAAQSTMPTARPRAFDLWLSVGVLPTGPLDSITDVAGVKVGHTTIIRGDDIRTGVTAILPHPGNVFPEKVPGLKLGRTGAAGSNRSRDYVIAFSSASQVRIRSQARASPQHIEVLPNDAMSPLFLAVSEATEEAVYNSLLRAITMTGRGHTVEALPVEKTIEILKKYGAIK